MTSARALPSADSYHPLANSIYYELADKTCASYECPENYAFVEDYLTTVCSDSGCTKHRCCKKDGELSPITDVAAAQ